MTTVGAPSLAQALAVRGQPIVTGRARGVVSGGIPGATLLAFTSAVRGQRRRVGTRKGVESSQRLGRHRWIVESCLSWLTRNRRLVRRYDRHADHFQAFADPGCAPISHPRWTKATK